MTEELAYKLMASGRYNGAIKIFEELLKNANEKDDRAHFMGEINACKRYSQLFRGLSPGEVFVPVFDQDLQIGYIIVLKVIKEKDKTIDEYISLWEKVKKTVAKLLENKLTTTGILDWGLDNYSIIFKSLPQNNNDYTNLTNKIKGSSVELGMAVAMISFLLNEKVTEFAFSGGLQKRNDEIYIHPVEYIAEKKKAVSEELSGIKFISAENGEVIFDDLLKRIWNNYVNLIEAKANFLGEKRITVKKCYPDSEEPEIILKFEHGGLGDNDAVKIFEFFKKIVLLAKTEKEGVILDGLKAAYLAPMFCAMQEVANHLSNFIAVRTGHNTRAVVIRTNNIREKSTRKVGDVFEYKYSDKD